MEVSALLGHGASAITKQRLCEQSDAYRMVFCTKCGIYAMSRSYATKDVHSCQNCGETDQSKYTTNVVPYGFKLLTNLLASLGVKQSFVFAKEKEGVETVGDLAPEELEELISGSEEENDLNEFEEEHIDEEEEGEEEEGYESE